jgi:hypothetical protein
MRKGNHIQSMHLLEELAHVGAGDGREQHELEIDSLYLRLGEVELVLK